MENIEDIYEYMWAVASFEPPPYPGRVTLFRTSPVGKEDAASSRWPTVAAEVEWHETPGTHDTMLRCPT
jgi:hypothetical protein